MTSVNVVVETGAKRVFASAIDWPGWVRTARTEEAALAALLEYAARYAPVAASADITFPRVTGSQVTERVPGTSTTDFGAPATPGASEREPVTPAGAERLAALLEAAWQHLDDVAAASPAVLRKGPRGGGRDREAMLEHVAQADAAYAAKVGVRLRVPEGDRAARAELRTQVLAAVRSRKGTDTAWPLPYYVRRAAWHALDHAWEMQDRSC